MEQRASRQAVAPDGRRRWSCRSLIVPAARKEGRKDDVGDLPGNQKINTACAYGHQNSRAAMS